MSDGIQRQSGLLIVMATVLFALALRVGLASSLAVITGTLLLGVALYSGQSGRVPATEIPPAALLSAVLLFALLSVLGWPPRGIGPTGDALESLPSLVWATLAVYVYLRGDGVSGLVRGLIVVLTLAFSAFIGVIHIAATDGVGLDVLALHSQAADALANGSNPYTEVVTVENGAPTARPGDVIEGYVYPPITAISYSIGKWTFSDPRYTSLVAWLVFLGAIGMAPFRRRSRASLLLLLMMAALPGWPIVLRAAWTEPLSLALAAAAFLSWRHPVVSGIFAGLTLGSKQYFVVGAPLLAFYRGPDWARRATAAVVVLLITIGAALVWDAGAFWSAAVEFHLSTPPRPDSQNLIGLLAALNVDVDLPSFLPILAGLGVSTWAAMRVRRRGEWVLALALTLAVSFVVSSQAFQNYWFLIAGLGGLCLLDSLAGTDTHAHARLGGESSSDSATDRYSSTT